MTTAQAAPAAQQQDNRLPFLWGTQEQRVPIASIQVTPGVKAPTTRVPKNGYLTKMSYRFVGAINVTTAGTGTPLLYNVLQSVVLSYNGGFQYRSVDGESLVVMYEGRRQAAFDPYAGSTNFKNYTSTSATNQTIGFLIEDDIALNADLNADRFLLAAQARNADIVLDVTFGTSPNGTSQGQNGIAQGVEVGVISGTLFIEGLYLLDPDYNKFKGPNLSEVQQYITDASFTNVTVGDNTVPVVPVNGPRYLQLYFKAQFNGTPDVGGYASAVTRVQLKINNGLNRYDMSIQMLDQENMMKFGRTTDFINTGWFLLDFLDDIHLVNAVSSVGRNIISTEKIAQFWLIVTVAAGTTLTANNVIKLIKRVRMPAA